MSNESNTHLEKGWERKRKFVRQLISLREELPIYGAPIANAVCDTRAGDHIHQHNIIDRYAAIVDMDAPRP